MQQWFRFEHDGAIRVGVRDSGQGPVRVHGGASILDPGAPLGQSIALEGVRLLAPVVPSKLIGLWNNFHEMAAKIGKPVPPEPLYFLKPSNSFINPGDAIRKPISYDGKVVYEGELGIVIGKTSKDVAEADAEAAIFGFTCVNDVTAIDLINKDPTFQQWIRAKGGDTFSPVGPCVATGLDWKSLRVQTIVGGKERQNYPISDMVFTPAQIVSMLSREMTLYPGDLISCGTSVGVLPMRPDTRVEIHIEGVGALINTYEPAAD